MKMTITHEIIMKLRRYLSIDIHTAIQHRVVYLPFLFQTLIYKYKI